MNDRSEMHADLGRAAAMLRSAYAEDRAAMGLTLADAVARGRVEETTWALAMLAGEALKQWEAARPGAATRWVERVALDAAYNGEADER